MMLRKIHCDIAKLLFEFGTMRYLPRMHKQVFLVCDPTDNIASHTARVAFIGLLIALNDEEMDVGKTVIMCLLHDFAETRSNDHNWVHKRYVKILSSKIMQEQFGGNGFGTLYAYMKEYEERKTKEARAAKDADRLDELLLLCEYTMKGHLEAKHWLSNDGGKNRKAERVQQMDLPFSRELALAIMKDSPTSWWKNLWTNKNH
jgi:putative hydrolase of HD superfamily